MKKKKILVYDDDEKFTKQIRDCLSRVGAVRDEFEVSALPDQEFVPAMDILVRRNRSMRKGDQANEGDCQFDDVDIVIVDQDLLDSTAGEFVTGENVAYLLRCFSSCRLVVVLNQFDRRGQVSFDLTLRGNPDSFADLNVASDQIHNPNLWGGEKHGFFPWHWLRLPQYLEDFHEKLKDVEGGLDSPIREVLGIPDDVFALLPRSAAQFLGKDPENSTFRQFVCNSGQALKRKDADRVPDEVIARLGAARISKWLERVVLPGQSILVDAPHLVSRYPSLLSVNNPKLNDWNATARLSNQDDCEVLSPALQKHRLEKRHWASKPVWYWTQVSEDLDIGEVTEPWDSKPAPYVFCEDDSQFHKEGSCQEFVAETESPFSRRFVKQLRGIEYRPLVRLSM